MHYLIIYFFVPPDLIIFEKNTGKATPASIVPIKSEEIKIIYKKDGWLFNWQMEYRKHLHTIYKLSLKHSKTVEGLVSLEANEGHEYIEMYLIENAPLNKGENRKYYGVASAMVAFACKLSIELGFEGYVAFTAKTKLIQHYHETLGADLAFGKNRMVILPEAAKKLVSLHYQTFSNG